MENPHFDKRWLKAVLFMGMYNFTKIVFLQGKFTADDQITCKNRSKTYESYKISFKS